MSSTYDFSDHNYDENNLQQLIDICSNRASLDAVEGKVVNFIENLSSFIQAISVKDAISQSLACNLIDILLNSESSEVLSRFHKVLPKIVKICLNLAESKSSDSSTHYSLNLLLCLTSNLKGSLIQTSNIRDLCKSYLYHPQHLHLASQILATLFSHDNSQLWISNWQLVILDYYKTISYFDMVRINEINNDSTNNNNNNNDTFMNDKEFLELIRQDKHQMTRSEGVLSNLESLALGLTNTLVQVCHSFNYKYLYY